MKGRLNHNYNIFFSNISEKAFAYIIDKFPSYNKYSHIVGDRDIPFYDMYNIMSTSIEAIRNKGRYFTPDEIAENIVKDLDIRESQSILEPSCGIGIFFYKIMDYAIENNYNINLLLNNIDLIEIDGYLTNILKLLILYYFYKNNIDFDIDAIRIFNDDYLLMNVDKKYDIILGNPPYVDTKFMDSKKRQYRVLYKLGKRNLFSMFLEQSIHLLSYDGKLSFIISESFNYLKSYEKFRKLILLNFGRIKIEHIGKNKFRNANIGGIVITISKSGNRHIIFKENNVISETTSENLIFDDFTLPFSDIDPEIIGILKMNGTLDNHIEYLVGIQTNNVKAFVTKQYSNGSVPYIKRLKRREPYWQTFDYWLKISELMELGNASVSKKHLRYADEEGIVFNNIDNDSIFNAVLKPKGYLFDIVVPFLKPIDSDLYSLLAYLNSHFIQYILLKLNGTPHTNIGDILKLPYLDSGYDKLSLMAKNIIELKIKGMETGKIESLVNNEVYKTFNISKILILKIENELIKRNIIIDKVI